MLKLPNLVLEEIRAHGKSAYPAEGCGVLLGVELPPPHGGGGGEGGFEVRRSVRMDNSRKGETNYEFVIEPEALLKVMKEARKEGLDIVGFYHSHPDHPARPSEKDRRWGGESWPGVAHLIQAVAQGEPGDLGAFVYEPEKGAFAELKIETV